MPAEPDGWYLPGINESELERLRSQHGAIFVSPVIVDVAARMPG